MITNIDPYFASTSTTRNAAHSRPTLNGASYAHISAFNPARAAREESFERTHGSLWVPGLLDRLTTPLTRYHE
jgi:hypothetical protein